MTLATLQVVKAGRPQPADPIDEEFEGIELVTDDAFELEPPELSIEELEKIFSDLN
jgi:hypothetical protein